MEEARLANEARERELAEGAAAREKRAALDAMNRRAYDACVPVWKELKARAVAAGAVGSRTMLSLRPERIVINPPAGSCDIVAPARVSDVTYLGDHLRVRAQAFGEQTMVVKVPNASKDRIVGIDHDIQIGWRAEDCHALDVSA